MIYYKKKAQQDVGATAIEYGLIASLISVLAVSGMSAVGVNLSNTYCTISKNLGGSGTCSGATSSNSSGTGGNGSSTGSGNSTTGNEGNNSTIPTSITTKDEMNNLKKSLVNDFYDKYLDKSLGGTGGWFTSNIANPDMSLKLMTDYNQNNPNDPITHVFGLYNASNEKPITSWEQASYGLEQQIQGNDLIGVGTQGFYQLEATTQSGHVYIVDTDNNKLNPTLTTNTQ